MRIRHPGTAVQNILTLNSLDLSDGLLPDHGGNILPVSYLGGNNFYDKNSSYTDVLNNLSDHNIKLGVKKGVLFDNDSLMDSYTNDRL